MPASLKPEGIKMPSPTPLFRNLVIQPTSACNLNCSYCYLPDRRQKNTMSEEVAQSIARGIELSSQKKVNLVWHGGEPLSCGPTRMHRLLIAFEPLRREKRIRHSIQTNGTLVSPEWCEIFRQYEIGVGVSLDGDSVANRKRVDWHGGESFPRVMKGIRLLQRSGIEFGIIAVVGPDTLDHARDLYTFFTAIGCARLNINIEEQEGVNQSPNALEALRVKKFWNDLFEAWRENPILKIREFNNVLRWLQTARDQPAMPSLTTRDFWPTVAFNGDVVVLSPEFISVGSEKREQFIVGNVTRETLETILIRSASASYVHSFFSGVEKCREVCEYYNYCRGGQASNKFFELGSVEGTQTNHCRNTKQLLIDAVLEGLTPAERR